MTLRPTGKKLAGARWIDVARNDRLQLDINHDEAHNLGQNRTTFWSTETVSGR